MIYEFRQLHCERVAQTTVTISRDKFPWLPFFRTFYFTRVLSFFNTVCGTTYLMRDDGATIVIRECATLKRYLFLKKPYGPFSPARAHYRCTIEHHDVRAAAKL